MGAVQSQSAGAGAVRPAGLTSFQDGLARQRADFRRLAAVWALRARLAFRPREWLVGAPAAAIALFDGIGRAIEALSWSACKAAVRAIQWHRVALVASAPFVLPLELRAALVRILAYLGAIAVLTALATHFFAEPEAVATAEPAPRPTWIEVDKPWPAFELGVAGFAEDDAHYAIRRHAAGGGRKDILSFGELGKTQRFMSVEIYRAGQEISDFGPAADEVRALGSELGRVIGLRSAMPLPSKFGTFRAFEFAIGPFGGYQCVGFVRAMESPRVQLSGLSCNMNLLVDRAAMSCALDRLTLVSAGSDPDIAKVFAQAELKRTFCGQRDPLMYATPKRSASADVTNSAKLKLRGRIAR